MLLLLSMIFAALAAALWVMPMDNPAWVVLAAPALVFSIALLACDLIEFAINEWKKTGAQPPQN